MVKNGEPKDFARSSENVPLMNEGGRFVSAEERLMKIIEPLAIDKIEQKYFNQWLKGELYPHVNAFLGDIFDKFGIQDTDTFGILELLVTRAKRSLPHNLVKRYPGIDIDLEITRLQESLPSLQPSSRSLIQYNTLVSRGMVHWLRILKNQKNKLFVE